MHFGKSRIFLLLCVSFIVGVFLGKWTNYYFMAMAAMFFIAAVTLGWGNRVWMVVGFAGLILLLGAWRYQQSFGILRAENFVGKYYGERIELEGVVVRDPDVRSNKVNLTLRPLLPSGHPPLARGGGELKGNVLLNVGRYPEYQYGDRLKFSGKLEEPFVTEDFSYKDYLSRYDTYAVIRFPKIEKTADGEGSKITAALFRFKHRLQDVITSVLPEPHASLLLGIILGLKRSLPESLADALAITGVSHIVVISGYNISLISKSLLKSRVLWGPRIAFALAVAGILGLVIMTGAEASVVRAAIMGFALIAAMGVGRIYQAQNLVIFAAALMVAQNPKILQFDIGFQLSFAATLGLIYLSPIFEKWLSFFPRWLSWFRSHFCASAAAIIFTLPLLVHYFDRISVVALLVNVLILWTVPLVMALGIIMGIAGLAWLPAAQLLGSVAWVLLQYIIFIVEAAARLPFAAAALKISIPVIIIYYLLLVSFLWWYRRGKNFWYYVEYVEMKL